MRAVGTEKTDALLNFYKYIFQLLAPSYKILYSMDSRMTV
jgi:hypothetical protein